MKIYKKVLAVLFILLTLTLVSCKRGGTTDTHVKITWVNEDNTVLKVDEKVLINEIPTYTGPTPIKTSENDYTTYTFDGWTPEVTKATKDATYKAKYKTILKTYTITWLDYDGSLLEEATVDHGTIPNISLPKDTVEYKYVGFDKDIKPATKNETYTLVRIKQTYTLSFETNGGLNIENIQKEYGHEIDKLEKPTKDGHVFIGWYYDNDFKNKVELPFLLEKNTKIYAAYNEKVPYGEYLNQALNSYKVSPTSFIPKSMQHGFNISNNTYVNNTYLNYTNISEIEYNGFGEQWNMILDNINQSETFFNILSTVDSITQASVIAFNNFLDSNPDDSNNFEFKNGIYNVYIKYENGVMSYSISWSTIKIELTFNIVTLEKEGSIELTSANKLRYIQTDSSYEFGIRYLGVRRAYIKLEKNDNGEVNGSIHEYLGIDNVFTQGSAAIFYINDEYVSVVGNKSDSMLAFQGIINELYQTSTGKLLGYEVSETLSKIQYNTLWFNLNDTIGINNIKAELKNPKPTGGNPNNIYINNQTSIFKTKNFGGFGLKPLSRRYDIEFRTQYVTVIEDAKQIVKKISVPMIFIQQEKLAELSVDIKAENSYINTFGILISEKDQMKIMSDYETLIKVFNDQKDKYTVDMILDFIN